MEEKSLYSEPLHYIVSIIYIQRWTINIIGVAFNIDGFQYDEALHGLLL